MPYTAAITQALRSQNLKVGSCYNDDSSVQILLFVLFPVVFE